MERSIRYTVRLMMPVIAALLLVAGFSLLGTGSASAANAHAETAHMSMTTTYAAASTTGSCASYDSWCAYCNRFSDAVTCDAIVPGHMTQGKVAGAANDAHNHYIPGVNFGVSEPGVDAPVFTGGGS